MRYIAQGDLNLFEVAEIPKGLKKAKAENGQHVLAHSETGHHHAVAATAVNLYNEDEFNGYLEVKKDTNIVHLRGFDTHAPVELKGGEIWKITRQREHTPDGWRRAAD